MAVTKKLIISGRVQGVGFRYSMVFKAQQLGVTGWVRNCPDGTVEAVVQGTEDQVQQITEWAQQGPSMASVDRVDEQEADGHFTRFNIKELL